MEPRELIEDLEEAINKKGEKFTEEEIDFVVQMRKKATKIKYGPFEEAVGFTEEEIYRLRALHSEKSGEVSLRAMVSSLIESIHEYSVNFSQEERLFVEHCQIKLDNDEQLTNQEIFRLNAFYRERGIEAMREKEERNRSEREQAEKKAAQFREKTGVDPMRMIEILLASEKCPDRNRLLIMQRELEEDGRLSSLELKRLFEMWREFTLPWWVRAWRWLSGLDWSLITIVGGIIFLVGIVVVFIGGIAFMECRSDLAAKIRCSGGTHGVTHYMKTVEEKKDMWEGYNTSGNFIQAPKMSCSINWIQARPSDGSKHYH
jgi:hypothetical protein